MPRTGTADLPLHPGRAPRWLFGRMTKLAGGISEVMVEEYGRDGFLTRLSDPFWFQAFSCVLGFDWHSSGTTTVTCGALKEALKLKDIGVRVAGGKGRASRKAPSDILELGAGLGINDTKLHELIRSSKLSAKVDTAAVQDGYQLYHHNLILTEDGKWAVIQQGMAESSGYARRYHWLSDRVKSFVEEPHAAIAGDERVERALDMTARASRDSRKLSLDLVLDGPKHLRPLIRETKHPEQATLDRWSGAEGKRLWMPRGINWPALSRAYEFQPSGYEELLEVKGVGPSTVRALALIAELVYGEEPSWRDPVKYSFTVGGKDGVPFPVDRKAMDQATEVLESAVRNAKVGRKDKLEAVQRLRRFVPGDVN